MPLSFEPMNTELTPMDKGKGRRNRYTQRPQMMGQRERERDTSARLKDVRRHGGVSWGAGRRSPKPRGGHSLFLSGWGHMAGHLGSSAVLGASDSLSCLNRLVSSCCLYTVISGSPSMASAVLR